MGVPHAIDATGAGAAILGCPFDCGTHPFRVGARQGPQAIRDQSGLVRRYQSEYADYDALERLGVVDCGDVRLTPSRIEDAFERIEEAAYRIAATGAVPVGFGGDGSVSLPLVRAAAAGHPNIWPILHIDSHTDAYPVDPEHRYDAATQFTHAALEQRVSASASFHVGLRGSTTRQGVYDHSRNLGYNLITMLEFWKRGPERCQWPRLSPWSATGRYICHGTWTFSIRPARQACARPSGAGSRRARGSICCAVSACSTSSPPT